MHEKLKEENFNGHLISQNIRELANQLLVNEYPHGYDNLQTFLGSFVVTNKNDETKVFPLLKSEAIQEIIESERIKSDLLIENEDFVPESKIVPLGPTLYPSSSSGISHSALLITNSARRLEVMKNCISCIFENKISDARKNIPGRPEGSQEQ